MSDGGHQPDQPGPAASTPKPARDVYDRRTFVVAVVGVFLVVVGTAFTGWQSLMMRQGLEEARAERRAWAKIEPYVRISEDRSPAGEKAIWFDAELEVENVGTTPAFDLSANWVLVSGPPGRLVATSQCEDPNLVSIGKHAWTSSGDGPMPGTRAVFAGESVRIRLPRIGVGTEHLDRMMDGSEKGATINFLICMDYRSASHSTLRKTSSLYRVGMVEGSSRSPSSWAPRLPDDGPGGRDDLRLVHIVDYAD